MAPEPQALAALHTGDSAQRNVGGWELRAAASCGLMRYLLISSIRERKDMTLFTNFSWIGCVRAHVHGFLYPLGQVPSDYLGVTSAHPQDLHPHIAWAKIGRVYGVQQ